MSLPEGVTLRWLERIEELRALEGEWQELAERTRADVYLRPAWLLLWWEHFGRGRRLACLELRREGRLAGLLPFALERLWAGPWPLRLARLAGTDPHCIVFQAPLEPELAGPAWRAALLHLCGPLRCAAVSLTPLSDRATHLPILRGIGAGTPGLALFERQDGSHVTIDLSGTFDEWLARLSRKRRKNYRRDLKALQSHSGLAEKWVVPDGAGFARFAELHQEQWRAVGRGGHFTDWPGSLDFYRDLADRPTAEPPVRLHLLDGKTGPLAMQFLLVAGGKAHWKLPARTLDPQSEQLSVGTVSLVRTVDVLFKQGIGLIEDGRGHYDYKLSYGGENVPVWRLLLFPDRPLARLRLRWLTGWSDLLNLLYYRIWFLKLAPRLQRRFGRRPRPLWRSWIRSRV